MAKVRSRTGRPSVLDFNITKKNDYKKGAPLKKHIRQQFIKDIAKLINYPPYQVEDILRGYEYIMLRNMCQRKDLVLWHFGKLVPAFRKSRSGIYNAVNQATYTSEDKWTYVYKPSQVVKDLLNDKLMVRGLNFDVPAEVKPRLDLFLEHEETRYIPASAFISEQEQKELDEIERAAQQAESEEEMRRILYGETELQKANKTKLEKNKNKVRSNKFKPKIKTNVVTLEVKENPNGESTQD